MFTIRWLHSMNYICIYVITDQFVRKDGADHHNDVKCNAQDHIRVCLERDLPVHHKGNRVADGRGDHVNQDNSLVAHM